MSVIESTPFWKPLALDGMLTVKISNSPVEPAGANVGGPKINGVVSTTNDPPRSTFAAPRSMDRFVLLNKLAANEIVEPGEPNSVCWPKTMVMALAYTRVRAGG